MHYPKIGDHPQALLNVLFTILNRSPVGGASREEIAAAYESAKGHPPSNKTISRIIATLNAYFDDPYGYSFAPISEEELLKLPEQGKDDEISAAIVARGRGDKRRYVFTREFKQDSRLDDPRITFLMALANNPQERNVMPRLFEVLMKIMVGDIFSRIAEWYQLQGEIEKYVLIKGFQPTRVEDNQRRIETILTAIRDRKRLLFTYRHIGSGQLQRREIEPYGLLCQQNVWYLSGRCYKQKELRLFRLDHINNLRRVELSTFKMPSDFTLQNQYGSSWGVWTGDNGAVETVRLLVEERLAEKFKVTTYHPSQQLKEVGEANLEVTFQVSGVEEMLPWLMMWGPTVEVLEPVWLREIIKENLQNSLDMYQGKL